MKPSNSSWLTTTGLMLFAFVVAIGGQGGPPNGGGEDEGLGNNLSVPTIFAEGYGPTGFPSSINPGLRPTAEETNPTLPYWDQTTIYTLDEVDYYPQQTASTWQADWRDGVPEGEHVVVNWSDNLLNTKWTAQSNIRVETVIYQDPVETTDTMTGYTMAHLEGLGTSEVWGADTTTYESTYRTVFSANARLKIERIDGPGGNVIASLGTFNGSVAEGFAADGPGSYGAEINVSGNLIYGFNWTLKTWPGTDAEKSGWWRITFTLDPTVTYTVSSEEGGVPTTYTVDRNVSFDALDASDTAAESLFRPRLVDSYTSVLDIEIGEEQTGGAPTMPLGITLAGDGDGTVTSNPAGISCPGDCSENYEKGTSVVLTAVAARRSDFVGWSGDADCLDGAVTMDGGRYCTAEFDGPGRPHGLEADVDGSIVTMSWLPADDVTGVTGYRIEGGTSPGTTMASVDLGTETTFVVTTLGPGKYFGRVTELLGDELGFTTEEVSFTITGAPSRPQGLGVSVNGSTVSLAWQPPFKGPVAGYEIDAGSASGESNLGTYPVGNTLGVSVNVGDGIYFVRVHAVNGAGRSRASGEVVFGVGAYALPEAPENLQSTVDGTTVSLSWLPPGSGFPPDDYVVEAGSAPGFNDIGSFPVPGTSLTVPNVPNGMYFVRVRARIRTQDQDRDRESGMGPASNGVAFAVGDVAGPAQPPAAPSGLTGIVSGNSVMLSWLSGSAGVPASHVVHVGSAPGADDVGMFVAGAAPSLSVSGVPAGTYYVRIVANNAFGTSAQSEELVVAVQ